MKCDQLFRKRGLPARARAPETVVDLDVTALRPSTFCQAAFLKRVDGLKLSRAYDLLRLAGGRTTDEEIRKATRDRVKKHRSKKKTPRRGAAFRYIDPCNGIR